MRSLFRVSIYLFLACSMARIAVPILAQNVAPKTEARNMNGFWLGKLMIPTGSLRTTFAISKKADGGLACIVGSPDQGGFQAPADVFTLKDNAVHMELKAVGAEFDGMLSKDGTQIEGMFKQRGANLPLTLKHIGRPQTPKPPYPYNTEDVTYRSKTDGVTLAGTLTFPREKGPFPAVVLIAGSGPNDRDEQILDHRLFLVLADYLTRRGIAVLRYDKRGIGKSTGKYIEATYTDFADDAQAGVEYLKTRKEIDAAHIGLLGHSEGGSIGPMVARRTHDVSFLVLLAGVGIPADQSLKLQRMLISKASGIQEAVIAKNEILSDKLIAIAKTETDIPTARKKLHAALEEFIAGLSPAEQPEATANAPAIKAQIEAILTPWFRSALAFDPAGTFRKLTCPVLALNGSKDVQVAPRENLSAIEAALKAGGNKDITIKELPGLNHLFQTAGSGNVDEYALIEETISPPVLQLIGDWIQKQTSAK